MDEKNKGKDIKKFKVLDDCRKLIRKNEKADGSEEYLYKLNLRFMTAVSIIVFATNLFWIVYDRIQDLGFHVYHTVSDVFIIIMIVASVYMFVLSFMRNIKDNRILRFSALAYYILLTAEVTVLVINRNASLNELISGNIPADKLNEAYSYVGVSIASLYLFAPALTPFPKKSDTVIMITAILLSLIIPLIVAECSVYGFFSELLLRAGVITTYVNQRSHAMRISRQNMRLANVNCRLENMAYVDVLTCAFNRRALIEYTKKLSKAGSADTLGVVFVDVDDFKAYNDTHSHIKGDEALAAVSGAINNSLFRRGLSLFRYGGEEFVIVAPDCDEATIADIAVEANNAVRALKIERDDDKSKYLTVTCGAACVAMETNAANELYYVMAADEQTYIGKSNGKDCVVLGDKIIWGAGAKN